MRGLLLAMAGSCAAVLLAALAACTTDYQKGLDDPAYGNPNALAGLTQPDPSSTQTGEAGTPTSVVQPLCVANGGQLTEAGAPCGVTFKNILAAFKTANCQTAGSCHGGASPPNKPRIDPDDPAGMWTELTAFKLSNGKMYIDPCSTDPTQSTISCNVNTAAPCGSQLMPPGAGLPANVIADIETWLKCGAPNN